MSKNYIQLEKEGEKIGLKFNNRTVNLIGEIIGDNPLLFKTASTDFKDLQEYARVILQAAVLSNFKSKKEETPFTEAQSREWVEEIGPQELYEIGNAYREFMTPKNIVADGEVGDDTRGSNWQELKAFAFGRLMLRPWEFYDYTFEEFLTACQGFNDGKKETVEMVRLIVWSGIAPHSKDKITPEQLFRLPGERKPKMNKEMAMDIRQKYIDLGILSDN